MCFSAEASFSASIVLGIVGYVAVKKTQSQSELPFASIPFLFAFQQFCEGILWLSLTNTEFAFLKPISTYLFLIFAQIIWPTWIPYSIMLLENVQKRKTILLITFIIGLLLSIYLTYCFIFYDISAEISEHHIKYNLAFPHIEKYIWITGFFYLVSTIVSTLVSSKMGMKLLGSCILLSSILTHLFTANYFISIWCFFAAIISVLVLLVIINLLKSTKWSEWFNRTRLGTFYKK